MSKSNVGKHVKLLGRTVRDKVTGFIGVVSSVSFDLYGCVQAAISPAVDKDGKLPDGRWFDVHRLEVTDTERVMPVPVFAAPAEFSYGPAEKPAGGR